MCRFKYCLNPISIPSHLVPLCIYAVALASPLIHILIHVFGLFGAAMQSKVEAISMLVLKWIVPCFENYVFRSRHPYVTKYVGVKFIPFYNCIRIDISDGTKLPETVAATETSSVAYTSFCKLNLLQREQLTCQHPRRANPHPVRGPAQMAGLACGLYSRDVDCTTGFERFSSNSLFNET